MSGYGNKIRELIQALKDSNSRVRTAEASNTSVRAKVGEVYRMAVQLKNSLASNPVAVENSEYPTLRTEDLAEFKPEQLIQQLGNLLVFIGKNTIEMRKDYRDLTAGLEDADAALSDWQSLRVGGNHSFTADGFRTDTQSKDKGIRPETPSPPLARTAINGTSDMSHPLSPPTTPVAKGGQGGVKESTADEKKKAAGAPLKSHKK